MTPPVAFLAMPEAGHFSRLRPLIAGLSGRGVETLVFTDSRFRAGVESAGGRFTDLFARYPIEAADDESLPVPCRFVSFAAHYADEIAADLNGVGLVVYDTFAVIGHVVGRLFGIPYVNVCAGHNMDPARFVPVLREDPRARISPNCQRAVEVLRERHGVEDASPFSYVSGLSPFLNVYCEPPQYLTEAERQVFEPVAFFGSLPPLEEIELRGSAEPRRQRASGLRLLRHRRVALLGGRGARRTDRDRRHRRRHG